MGVQGDSLRVLVIDHFDSFTYNLVDLVSPFVDRVHVVRYSDELSESQFCENPSWILLGPGPGRPEDYPRSLHLISELGFEKGVPILGVCLGMQLIVKTFGGVVKPGLSPMHGKSSLVYHHKVGFFEGVESPVSVARYHSLVAETPLPPDLELLSWTEDGIPMAVQHRSRSIFGVQFHPESFLTLSGARMIENFTALLRRL